MNELLDREFAEYPVLVAGPASPRAVQEIEEYAGFPLPESYRAFVARYGGAIVGPYAVFGSGAGAAMGAKESSAIEVTNHFREDNWPGSHNALVVSMDHAGNAIMAGADGRIFCFDHDAGEFIILASDFERFILVHRLKHV